MQKKLNSMPDYKARMPRQPHDVGQSFTYTSSTGMILPVYYDMLHTGDELHFNANLFTRLNPMSIASLGDIDIHLDYFFVPLSLMYLPSTSMFYQTDDLFSGVFRTNSPGAATSSFEKFPVLDFTQTILDMRDFDLDFNSSANSPVPMGFGNYVYPTDRFECQGRSVFRMLDHFELNPLAYLDPDSYLYGYNGTSIPVTSHFSFTPWFPLAYQAAYQLYYRNDDREPKNYHFNMDQYCPALTSVSWSEGFGSSNNVTSWKKSIFSLNYAQRPKDYFNSVKVSPVASSVSMLNGVNSYKYLNNIHSFISGDISGASTNVNTFPSSSGNGSDMTTTDLIFTNDRVSAAGIRQLFMLDKMLRVIGRADKNYESQFLAHYGVKIPHDDLHNITHIGHDMVTMTPELIMSTANTYNGETGSPLGEVGGQGQSMLNGRKRHFKAPFHGVFLVCAYSVPRQRYMSGFNKLHSLNSPMDFWQPEYDRKGMQPLFYYETSLIPGQNNALDGTRLGWQFAYEQFKRKYDRVSTAFEPAPSDDLINTYSPWVISVFPYQSLDSNGSSTSTPPKILQPWVFMSTPNDINGIMQVPHQTSWFFSDDLINTPWLIYHTDPFIHDFRMNCKKVNFMSEYGEPEL